MWVAPWAARRQRSGIGDAARENLRPYAGQQLGVGLFLGPSSQAEHDDLGAAPPAFLGEVRADEAGSSGDQQPHPKRSARAATMRPLASPSP